MIFMVIWFIGDIGDEVIVIWWIRDIYGDMGDEGEDRSLCIQVVECV